MYHSTGLRSKVGRGQPPSGNRPFFPAVAAARARVDPAIRADMQSDLCALREINRASRRTGYRRPLAELRASHAQHELAGIQDALGEDARAVGFDVCDVCAAFRAWPNKVALYIPDKHYSDVGNRLLLSEILSHLKQIDPHAADLPNPAEVRP